MVRHDEQTAHGMVDLISSQLVYGSRPGVKMTSRLLTQHLTHHHTCAHSRALPVFSGNRGIQAAMSYERRAKEELATGQVTGQSNTDQPTRKYYRRPVCTEHSNGQAMLHLFCGTAMPENEVRN